MPFSQPIVAGEELIRSAIRSENWDDGSSGDPATGWRITRDGDASFNSIDIRGNAEGESASFDTVSANTSLLYRGDEMADLLENNARGLVAFAQYHSNAAPATTGELAFLRLDVELLARRVYRIATTPFLISNSHGGGVIRYTAPAISGGVAANPTLASPFYTYSASTTTGATVSNTLDTLFYPPLDGTYKFLFSAISFNGTSNILSSGGAPAPNPSLWLQDVGKFVLGTGISDPLGVSVPSKQFRTFEVIGSPFRSYKGSGAFHSADFLYQGQSPTASNGRLVGWTWMPLGSVGSGGIADMAGVPPSDISYFEIYIFYPHWYYSTGGVMHGGYHTNGTIPGVGVAEHGGGIASVFTQGFSGRNQGIWLSMAGGPSGPYTNALSLSVNAGTFRGVIIGDHAMGGGLTNYGYASECKIRGGYYK
jgi:hypothetical protein